MAQGIELAVETSKNMRTETERFTVAKVEMMLKRLTPQVSNTARGRGNLQLVRDFNAFLQRTALAIEAKSPH